MKIAIQQPECLPWPGFFDKMANCDVFVLLDNVQFKKRYFENRNKIRTKDGWQWITIPVKVKGKYKQRINEVEIDNSINWQKKVLGTLTYNYIKAKYYNEYFDNFEKIILKKYDKLIDFNLNFINLFKEILKIETKIILASILNINEEGSDLILNISEKLGAEVYISGPDGAKYLREEEFKEKGIKIIYHHYLHPVYKQIYETFIEGLSIIDLIFNCGAESLKILKNENKN
ncbi:MAG: WbqC family protein, partial [Armatimonadetes bacterium]|nr:WbqC family protein [Armatimonadota bacterium]